MSNLKKNLRSNVADIEITSVIDDDTMSTASNSSLATSESIKAYVDSQGGGGGLSAVVDDTSPTLGGNLSTAGHSIVFSSGTISDFYTGSSAGSSATVALSEGAIQAVITARLSAVGGGMSWSKISSNTNAVSGNGYLIDASGGNVTLTLPSSPSEGNIVGWVDAKEQATTNTITIARNGENIFGIAEDVIVDVNGAGAELVYVDATYGWQIVTEITKGEGGRQTSVWIDAGAFLMKTTDPMIKGQTELSTNNVVINFAEAELDVSDTNYGIQFKIVLPNNFDIDSGVSYKIHWTNSDTAGTGDVVFGVKMLTAGDSGPLDTTWTSVTTVTDTFITSGDNHITPQSGTISLSGSNGDLIGGEITIVPDNGSWTYTQNVRILGLELIYTAV